VFIPRSFRSRLGHSTINITLDTYSHVMQRVQHQAAEKVVGLLVNQGRSTWLL